MSVGGEVPSHHDLQENKLDQYEQRIFSLDDLTSLYKRCASYDERIKTFVEKISEFV
jgi:hypothetical protein